MAGDRRQLLAEQLERTRKMMDAHADECLIEGFEGLIGGLELPDPDDRHVLAAAVVGRVDVIVTKNLADFPEAALARFGIEAQYPDKFILHLIDLAPVRVCSTIRTCHGNLRNPPMTVDNYLAILIIDHATRRLALTAKVMPIGFDSRHLAFYRRYDCRHSAGRSAAPPPHASVRYATLA